MKIRFIIPFVICIVMLLGSAGSVWGGTTLIGAGNYDSVLIGTTHKQLLHLDAMANELYKSAYMNNRQAGYIGVQQVLRIVEGDLKYKIGKIEGWNAIEQDAIAIEQALANGVTTSGWLMQAARIRLATDALIRSEHALWLQYESLMLDDLSRVERSWKRQAGDGAVAARATMNALNEHANRIEPAIALIYGSAHQSELLERIRYTNQLLDPVQAKGVNSDQVNKSLIALKAAIIRLYDASGRADVLSVISPVTAANPLSWSLFFGAIISAVLTYSGWRKYKREPYGVKPLV